MEIQIDLPHEPMVTLTEECAGDIDILTPESNTDLTKRSTTTTVEKETEEKTKDQQIVNLIENKLETISSEFTEEKSPASNTKSNDNDDPSPMILEPCSVELNELNNDSGTHATTVVEEKMIDLWTAIFLFFFWSIIQSVHFSFLLFELGISWLFNVCLRYVKLQWTLDTKTKKTRQQNS